MASSNHGINCSPGLISTLPALSSFEAAAEKRHDVDVICSLPKTRFQFHMRGTDASEMKLRAPSQNSPTIDFTNHP